MRSSLLLIGVSIVSVLGLACSRGPNSVAQGTSGAPTKVVSSSSASIPDQKTPDDPVIEASIANIRDLLAVVKSMKDEASAKEGTDKLKAVVAKMKANPPKSAGEPSPNQKKELMALGEQLRDEVIRVGTQLPPPARTACAEGMAAFGEAMAQMSTKSAP